MLPVNTPQQPDLPVTISSESVMLLKHRLSPAQHCERRRGIADARRYAADGFRLNPQLSYDLLPEIQASIFG